jgi:tetratricopeptide (TPR) repeat protein
LVNDKAAKAWGVAFKLAGEGKFKESSESCKLASKLYLRASKLAVEERDILILQAYSLMLRASMHEAIANEFIKKMNDAKSAVRQFELALEQMKEAIDHYPKGEEDRNILKKWGAQMNYYQGYFYQSQGIHHLDEEKYPEALALFNQANEAFQNGMKDAVESRDEGLKNLLEKSLAEAKGYIGMCKTVLD